MRENRTFEDIYSTARYLKESHTAKAEKTVLFLTGAAAFFLPE